jgi:hypothetical protein
MYDIMTVEIWGSCMNSMFRFWFWDFQGRFVHGWIHGNNDITSIVTFISIPKDCSTTASLISSTRYPYVNIQSLNGHWNMHLM